MADDAGSNEKISRSGLREALRQSCRQDERERVAALVREAELIPLDRQAATAMARRLIETVRQQRRGASGVDHLMHEFSLSSQEGVALMCLAEALLRIPDRATVDRLIRDKLSRGDWKSHLGHSRSLFVNAATWGLMLGGNLLAPHFSGELGLSLNRALAKGGEPLIRKAMDYSMRLLGQQFVMGESIATALERSRANAAKGYTHSFDMLGESALTDADAERYRQAYETAIHAIGQASAGRGIRNGSGISIKLSALHPRYTRSQRARVMTELGPRLQGLARLARAYDIGLNIDAEEADRLELSLDLLEPLIADPQLAGWTGLGMVVQAYQKRAPFVIDLLADLARRHGRRLMVRLVKGAYWDSEIKRAQVEGLSDYPVFTRKAHTDLCYLVCAARLLAVPDAIYPQFATHNALTLASVIEMAGRRNIEDYEFQCLHGMGEVLYGNVLGPDNPVRRCRIYAPVGSHEVLLPYLVRRLLENGANSSFVNRLVDEAIPLEDLLEDPLAQTRRDGGGRHPVIPLPADLFAPGRVNSAGSDLDDEATLCRLQDELAELAGKSWQAAPLLAGAHQVGARPGMPVTNPANRRDRVGTVIEATPESIEHALLAAAAYADPWHRTPPAERAAALLRVAELLELARPSLFSLCIREAGKTLPNAVAEVREAVDFCRYYAQQLLDADFQPPGAAPGPVVCISPWNFPLAIFMGQISAALAAGSPVIAKPAEQTPLIAAFVVALMYRAGIPRAALQLLPGQGETVGAALTADTRVRGVLFTGSTEVGRLINRSIAGRPGVRLVAETGGQNAMIVDSSALPEQVVQDVLNSAFDSAGQRCSALRVLCLQADIADRVMAQLRAAMQTLAIGDPSLLATDVGPLIDEAACDTVVEHIARIRQLGHAVLQWPLPAACSATCFVPPTLIEINRLDELPGEIFGPVVHVLRFAGEQLAELVDAINTLGYGLTLGLHSRIDEHVELVGRRARVGNLYINRNMVGAVVGVQPFGGEGLSGTGPKAGGPLYLHRLGERESLSPADVGGRPGKPPAGLARLGAWAAASGDQPLADLCAGYAAQTLLGARIDLPGPTGERNSLSFAPRGRMLCLAEDEARLLHQLAAVLATGNQAVLADNPVSQGFLSRLPEDLAMTIERQAADDFRRLAGVLFAGASRDGDRLRPALAAQSGPLIPLYVPGPVSAQYPLFRMLVERVVTVNTTAGGGNADLMSLAN